MQRKGAKHLVTATQDPLVLRVSFPCRETPLSRSDIICNVRAVDDGIEVEYLYHDQQVRTMAGGTWGAPQEAQMKLGSALISEIETGVMYELWEAFKRRVRVMEMP